MRRALSLVGLFAFAAVATPAAHAHTMLSSPAPRVDNDGLKSGPCGPGSTRTDTPMIVAPGSTLTVQWLETVNHPGYFRLALSMGGDQGFDDHVLADDIADQDCQATPCNYTEEVQLPDVECLECTLQLIQFMGTAEPYSPYFSCADLMITNDPPDGGGGGDGDGDGTAGGGCQVTSTTGRGAATTILLLCLVLGITSRRK